MLRSIALIAVLFVLSINTVFALNIDDYTKDEKIKAALVLLEQNNANEVFENLDNKPAAPKKEKKERKTKKAKVVKSPVKTQIAFYDLSELSYEYSRHYAVNIKKNGKTFIYINTRYQDAPAEAIACLIVHESFHKLREATLKEETLCTTMEAKYWNMLKDYNKIYSNEDVLVFKLDNLRKLYLASSSGNDLIRNKIANNSFYKSQLAVR